MKLQIETLAGTFDSYFSKQYDIEDLEVWLSSEFPFKTADEAFKQYTDDTLSADHVFETVNRIGNHFDTLDICPAAVQIEQEISEFSKGKFRHPVMMIAIDDFHAPTRPEPSPCRGKSGKGKWKEAEDFQLYLINVDRIINWHQIQDEKEFVERLLKIRNDELIPDDKSRLCIIGDGSPRVKHSGAWWYITNANNILNSRCTKCNGAYNKIIHKWIENKFILNSASQIIFSKKLRVLPGELQRNQGG